MKLLFDENLSPKQARLVRPIPDSAECPETGYGQTDEDISLPRNYARTKWVGIVSKDSDFYQRARLMAQRRSFNGCGGW